MIFKKNKNRGLTLLETLLLMGILSLLAVPIGIFIYQFFFYHKKIDEQILIENQIRGSLEKMVQEIRKAAPSDAGSYPLESAQPQSIVFFSDINNDGLREKVRYFLDGEILKKGFIKSRGQPPIYNPNEERFEILATGVKNGTSSIFSYYDSNYVGVQPPLSFPVAVNAVRMVKISLIIGAPQSRPADFFHLSTKVTLRNLRTN